MHKSGALHKSVVLLAPFYFNAPLRVILYNA